MADLNWSLTGTASATGYTRGTPPEIKDDNAATYCGDLASGTGSGSFDYTCEVAMSETVLTVNKAEIYHHPGGFISGGGMGYSGNWYVDLYYSAAWHQVMNGTWSLVDQMQTDSDSTGWSNVTKIRLRADGIYGGPPGTPRGSAHDTHELRLWGPLNYSDMGLRIRTSGGTIKIGTQALNGHQLRIRKGGTTYGIPLITPGADEDSGLRIWDGSAVKALPKVD